MWLPLLQEIRTAYDKKGLFFAGDAQMDLDGSTPEQEEEALKQESDLILYPTRRSSDLSYLSKKSDAIRKTLHEQSYSCPGLALYIDSLSPKYQYYLLRDGFSENQRKTIWPYLSEEADLAWEYNGHLPEDLDGDITSLPP